jgi:hypothetical protein
MRPVGQFDLEGRILAKLFDGAVGEQRGGGDQAL